ncbi:MAG: ATP/GTP-binding protein [Anaerolineae bacterium]|nr:ATP/GTP-binding protein [Anaerolineae bacterium]MDQ7035191.1 ATP/GTP-binding protein [Anaerolineae bacterium]
MPAYKIIVTGPFNSGKTEFVKNGSDIPMVETEKNITTEDRGIKASTTVAMDFGRMEIDDDTVHLFGTPGQTRFSFMWEILASEMNGFIVLVDSTDTPSFPEAAELIEQFSGFVDVPYMVVSNKMDLEGAASTDEVRSETHLAADVPVLEATATSKESVRNVVKEMLALIKR